VEGKTGYIFQPEDPTDLMMTIQRYFSSPLYEELAIRREGIRDYAMEHHSWDLVGSLTMKVYADLLQLPLSPGKPTHEISESPLKTKMHC